MIRSLAMKRSAVTLAALTIVATTSAISCSDTTDCNEAGCFDGLVISFVNPLEAEDVAVTVQFDDTVIRCDATSDDPVSCREAGVTVEYARPGSVMGLILHDQFPEEVTLTIVSSGTSLVHATVKPQYQTLHPNGRDCPPACRQAYVEL